MFSREKQDVHDLLCQARLLEILAARIVNHGMPGPDLRDMALVIHGATQKLLQGVEDMEVMLHSIGRHKEIGHDD